MSSGRLWRAAAAAPDLLVIAGWWALIVAIGFLRKDFGGEGVRHLPAVLESARPHLGEPRWLFFPALLFVLLRPAVAFGLVHDVEALAYAMMAAAVPLVMIGALAASGNGVGHAVARAALGEENPLYRSHIAKPGLTPYLVALAAGPPQELVTLGDQRGFRGVLANLRTTATRWPALQILLRLGFSMAVLTAGVIAALRRRDWPLVWSVAPLAVLPVVRSQQYGYVKFYVLLPIVLAIGAARAPAAAAVAIAGLMLALNAGPLLTGLPAQRRLYHDRVDAYARADAHSCWLTTGWVPTFSFRWPGAVCPILGSLAKGSGEDVERVTAAGRAALTACLEDCFCRSSAVFTDDMTESARPLVADSARHFGYTAVDLQAVVLPVQRARLVSRPGSTLPVYQYPSDEQRRRCELVSRHR